MMETSKLIERPDRALLHSHMRIDGRRDTRLMVQRNVSGHIHITLGRDEVTMILHPHLARRLIADMQAVLDGSEFEAA